MIALSQMPLVISALAFVFFFLAFVGVRQFMRAYGKRQALLGRINSGNVAWESPSGETLSSPVRIGAIGRLLEFFGSVGKRKEQQGPEEYSNARVRFLRAGLQKHSAPKLFWGAKILLACLIPLIYLSISLSVLGIFNPTKTIGFVAGCGLLGFYLPEVWLMVRTSSRKQRIFERLPDALDLMVVCVEAGMGLDQAVNQIGEELKLNHKDLSDEFKFMNLELRAGKSRQAALRNLAVRTGVEEVNSVAPTLVGLPAFPPSTFKRAPSFSFFTREVIVIRDTEPIEASASPRNPSVEMEKRSSERISFEVA